jgi:DNA-binding YbaB/EbfC family protein
MDLFKMLGQFKDMQARLQATQAELEQRSFTALAGGGAVTAEVNGKLQLRALRLDPAVVDPADIAGLEDLILVAVNDAQRKAAEAMQLELGKLTGGMDLPFKLPF